MRNGENFIAYFPSAANGGVDCPTAYVKIKLKFSFTTVMQLIA